MINLAMSKKNLFKKRFSFSFLSAFLSIGLIGCSILPEPDDSTDRFLLEAVKPSPVLQKKNISGQKRAALIVDQPIVYAPLDNTRVAIKPTEHTIDYIADIEWGDRLGTLIHESMIQSLQNASLFSSVGRLNSGLQAQYLLSLDVRKFQKRCCDKTAEVEYFVEIFDMTTRHSMASKLFSCQIPLKDTSAKAVAVALNEAHKSVTTHIMQWLVGKNISS